jgi:hypothetical protein
VLDASIIEAQPPLATFTNKSHRLIQISYTAASTDDQTASLLAHSLHPNRIRLQESNATLQFDLGLDKVQKPLNQKHPC